MGLPALIMLIYFFRPARRLRLSSRQDNWREVFYAAYNGVSELINTVSGAVIAFILNWMLIDRAGVNGVAAITVVNYLLVLSFIVFFAISDTIQVMISQNFGAARDDRIRGFVKPACCVIAVSSVGFIALFMTTSESLMSLFFDEKNSTEIVVLTTELVSYVWPLFLFAGFLLMFYYLVSDHRFVAALPTAEAFTFILALIIFLRYRHQGAMRAITRVK